SGLAQLLDRGIAQGPDADPSQIVAAAAVVAAGLPDGGPAWRRHPQVDTLLEADAAVGLAATAVRALRACLPEGGWYWASWLSERDLAEARDVVAGLLTALGEDA